MNIPLKVRSYWIGITALVGSALAFTNACADDVKFQEGERVVLPGNTFAERTQVLRVL